MRLEHRELSVGGRACADDGAAAPDLVAAAERVGIGRAVVDRPLQHVGDRDRARIGDESAVHAIALRAPLVLYHDRARDRVDLRVAPGIEDEMARQCAIERSDRDRIVDQGAAVGRAQLERRVIERGPDRPPDIARIPRNSGR